ncbi:MAG TPA: sigma-70 family RNA polymerase sigma factor [Clostridiales bacterium]|nr:sigma-70 family RNA polymerase sigma factor [Clostridiales bacterium]
MNIIKRILAGETEQFEKLVLANQTGVYNLALRMVGNEEDAFDMAQEAFLRAYNSLEKFRGDSKFSVWLYRLTTNICIDFLRRRKRRQTVSITYISDDEENEEMEIPDQRFSPETELERKELLAAVERGLQQLPHDYRQILVLRGINGLSYEEIGRVLSLEEGTVKSRIFRARKKLCSILMEDGNISASLPSNGSKGGVKRVGMQ